MKIPSTGADPDRVIELTALAGIVAQVTFVILVVVWGFVEKSYDAWRQDYSDFGALDASHPLPYNIILTITGLLTISLALGLYRALPSRLVVRLGLLAIGVFAVGQALDGVLREDCSPSGSSVCRAALDDGNLSWHHTAHDLESLVTFAAITLAPLLLAIAFRRDARWRRLFAPSVVAFAVILSGVVLYFAMYYANNGSPFSGAVERAFMITGATWLTVLAWNVWRAEDESVGARTELASDAEEQGANVGRPERA